MDSINILPQTERSGWLVGIEIDSSVKLIDRYTPAALPAPQCRSSQQETCVSLRWTTALPGSPGNPPPGWSGVTASCTSRPTGCRPQRWVSTTYQTTPAARKVPHLYGICRWMLAKWRPICWRTWPPWRNTLSVCLPSMMKEKLKLWPRASQQVQSVFIFFQGLFFVW